MAANPTKLNDRPAPTPPAKRVSAGQISLAVIAVVAAMAALYYARIVFIVTFVSLLLAFVLEPVTTMFQRIRLPRPVSALLAVLLFCAALWGIGYVSYNKATDFIHQLPRYKNEIRRITSVFQRNAQTIQRSTEQVIPKNRDKNTITVQQQSNWTDKLFSSMGTATEIVFAVSFIPFLVYFMLTWKEHTRRCTVMLFPFENRSTAYATLAAVTDMIRGFIVGNFLIGLFMGAISTAVFGILGLPYFYFIGFISGFLSLVPYLGVILATVPPLLSGIGHLHSTGILIVLGTVLGLHLFALNVLYPKFLGERLALNPLTVTLALLFWGWIWGAVGLFLAIPATAACKIVCDHVESLRPVGAWLGE